MAQQGGGRGGGGGAGNWGVSYTPTDNAHLNVKPRVGGGTGGTNSHSYYGSMNTSHEHTNPVAGGDGRGSSTMHLLKGWSSKLAAVGGGGGGEQQQHPKGGGGAGTPDTTPMMNEREIYYDDQGSQYTAVASNQSSKSGTTSSNFRSSSKQNIHHGTSQSCGNIRLAHHESYAFTSSHHHNGASTSTSNLSLQHYHNLPPSSYSPSQESRGSKAANAILRRSSPRCMGLFCSGFFGLVACLFIGVVTNGPLRRLWHSMWVDTDSERLKLYGPNLHFPSDFVWGAATSSYQIEGATDEGGRLPSIWDTFCHEPNYYSYDNDDSKDYNDDDDTLININNKRHHWFMTLAAANTTDDTSDKTIAMKTNSTTTNSTISIPSTSSMLLPSSASSLSSSSPSWTSPILDGSSGDGACDHYHKFEDDVNDIMSKQLGLKAYRFSISWSRILPHGTGLVANPEGVAFYNRLIDALLSKGIEPYVTLYHWDLPQALEDKYGGWLSSQIIHDFGNYARICYEAFGDRVINWITINEAWTIAVNGYNNGVHAPGHYKRASTETYIVGHHLLLAHARAVRIYRHEGYRDKAGLKRVSDVAILNASSMSKKKLTRNNNDDEEGQGTAGTLSSSSSSRTITTPEQQQQHIPHNANPILSDRGGGSYGTSGSSPIGGRYGYGAQAHGFGNGRIGMSNCGDFRFPLREKNRLDMAAAERAMEFQMGWFTDPLYYGEYPAVMRRELKHRLPQFTSEQRAQLIGSTDFIGLNHYSSLLATTRPKNEDEAEEEDGNMDDDSYSLLEDETTEDEKKEIGTKLSYDRHVATNQDRSKCNNDDDDALMQEEANEDSNNDDHYNNNDSTFESPGYWYDMRVDLSLDDKWESNYMNWAIVPEGCFMMLQWIADRYNNPPIYITENGSCEDDDNDNKEEIDVEQKVANTDNKKEDDINNKIDINNNTSNSTDTTSVNGSDEDSDDANSMTNIADSVDQTKTTKTTASLLRDLVDGIPQNNDDDDILDKTEVIVVKDPKRRNYFEDYIRACAKAIEQGVNLKGYFAWSLMDNFEWQFGYQRRFGLYYVNFTSVNKTRTPKESAIFYSNVIKTNGNNIPRITSSTNQEEEEENEVKNTIHENANRTNSTVSGQQKEEEGRFLRRQRQL